MQRSWVNAPGSAFHHLRRTLSRTLINILLFGLIGALVGALATEVIGAVLTGTTPASPTHVAAGVVAVLLGYVVALSVAFRALLKGIAQSADWVVGEVERVVGGVAHEAEAVLHIPEDIARASEAAAARDDNSSSSSARQPVEMIAGIPDEA